MLKIIPRRQLNTKFWDNCVAVSTQRIVYGYSWYLDAVLPASSWKWVGIVLTDQSGAYLAVMPIPLRRKVIVGISYEWVVHQPFFCQFLGVFSQDESLDLRPFFELMTDHFRYGSVYCSRQQPDKLLNFDAIQAHTTHTIDLAAGYEAIYQNYSHDRKLNLRRAIRTNWTIVDSTDPEPLLALFHENHADTIDGGVADWAYSILRNLTKELSNRGLAMLRYAVCDGRIDAGALFVCEGNRIIYLFNAASEAGRRGNARTLLIDQLVQEKAGRYYGNKPVVFDFESPEKPSIRDFYQSFGAVEQPFWAMRWNRLMPIERALLAVRSYINR